MIRIIAEVMAIAIGGYTPRRMAEPGRKGR
jgi:hypothetical protein